MGQCFSAQENKAANTNTSKVVKTKEEKNVEKVPCSNCSISNPLKRKMKALTKVKRLGKRQSTIKRHLATITSRENC